MGESGPARPRGGGRTEGLGWTRPAGLGTRPEGTTWVSPERGRGCPTHPPPDSSAFSFTDPAVSMDLLRAVLQPSINEEIRGVFNKYMKVRAAGTGPDAPSHHGLRMESSAPRHRARLSCLSRGCQCVGAAWELGPCACPDTAWLLRL